MEVDNLLESYRLSNQNPSTHGMDSLSSDLRSQRTLNSEAMAGIIQDHGKKRHLEEEPAPAQKKKGKGHMKEEDYGEDDVDAEDQARSRKRPKRADLKRDTWQEFGSELDSAGATMAPFPISLDLADMNLPFRLKK